MSPNTDFVLWVILACIAAPHTLNLGHNARISTLQPFVLGAVALFGTGNALVLSAVSMTYFALVSRPRPPLYKNLYNLGNMLLATGAAGAVFYKFGGRTGDLGSSAALGALFLAVVAFFLVNTGLVALAVGLEGRIDPFRVWFEKYSWTISAQLAGGSLVILVGMLRQRLGAQVFFLAAPFCILSYQFYKVYFSKATRAAHRT
jgi:hypothetical protein